MIKKQRRETLFIALVAALVCPCSAFVNIQSADGTWIEVLENQVLVRYKQGQEESVKTTLQATGASASGRLDSIGVEIVRVPPGQTVQSFIAYLKTLPEVDFVEPNGRVQAFDTPNDPKYLDGSQYYLYTNLLNMASAWDITKGSSTVVIADVDTGVLLTHADLRNNLWDNPNISGNSGRRGTRILIDNDNDGDCAETGDQCAGPDPTDDNIFNSRGDIVNTYHGTHVAGIMAATTNNGLNMAGIAQNCRIMAVKALNAFGGGSDASVAAGILYAADNGASIINLSLGADANSATLASAVDYALSKNIVIVAASGNTADAVKYPAAISRVIAVGATDSNDALASFSCRGRELDLVAPGVGILSTTQGGTSSLDGTSFAAPMVSGVAALIRSLDSTLSVDDVTRYLNFYAKDLGAPGFDTTYGFGRLDAFRTLEAVRTHAPFISNPVDPGQTFPYPNPYNPDTGRSVTIALPQSLGTEGITIEIHNTAGERVKTLNDTNQWDGQNDSGDTVTSGLYYYFVKTSKGDVTGKITVLR